VARDLLRKQQPLATQRAWRLPQAMQILRLRPILGINVARWHGVSCGVAGLQGFLFFGWNGRQLVGYLALTEFFSHVDPPHYPVVWH
jgi:hypothetical protein